MTTRRERDVGAPLVYADPDSVAELAQLRRREVEVLSERLGRVDNRSHAGLWRASASILASVGLGALLAGIPLLSSTTDWDKWVKPVYASSVLIAFGLAGLCALAGRSVDRERADSVGAIKTDLDALLSAYELPPVSTEIDREVLRHFLQPMRDEARDNRTTIEHAIQSGQFWKLTDAAPVTKQWKKNRTLLEGEKEHEELYDAGRRAAAEVDRVGSVRSFRMFRGSKVRGSDQLQRAAEACRAFEDRLTSEMDAPAAQGA